jgi:hypothetical protein
MTVPQESKEEMARLFINTSLLNSTTTRTSHHTEMFTFSIPNFSKIIYYIPTRKSVERGC